MEERNDLIKELFELHKLLADKGEIGIGYGFSKNYNRLKKQVKKLTLTDVVASEKINPPLRDTNTYFEDSKYVNKD